MAQLAEFIGNHIFLSMGFIVVLFMFISLSLNDKMQSFNAVNPAQLTQLVNHKNAILIDVRDEDSFKQGHIVNALNLPLNQLLTDTKAIEKFKGKPVIAYCARGQTSATACKHLTKQGIETVFNLSGGIGSWVTEKLPLVKS
jgi:rhodanese-related sulfurtransferase